METTPQERVAEVLDIIREDVKELRARFLAEARASMAFEFEGEGRVS